MKDYKTHTCNEISLEDVGKKVRIAGWVETIRDLGGLVFLDIRDMYGITQVVTSGEAKEVDFASHIPIESTVTVYGTVKKRDEETINPKLKTGLVEIKIEEIKILGKRTKNLPFEINTNQEIREDLRLQYRYLDLRNERLQKNLKLRAEVLLFLRNQMQEQGFLEVQTPILTSSSPEGARDYLVPSRLHSGKFYALPQAPQQFKQLLMVSGIDKYFQIAPCFRDEDARADRAPGEFYQLDMEMSFATQEDVFQVMEPVMYNTFKKFSDKKIAEYPFPRITYKEAILKYGSDKPDLRNPLVIEDLTDILSKSSFEPFKTSLIRGITVKNIDKSNSWYKSMEEYMKSVGAPALAYIKVNEDMTFKSSLDKFLTDEIRKELVDKCNLEAGSTLFVLADSKNKINKLAGLLRIKLGNELDLLDKNKFEFCIINDFPMYEYNEEENTWDFGHNPFSMPQGGLEALTEDNIENVVAYQYDFVCNGYEMASGAVRNHDIRIMKRAFELAGYTDEDVETKFRSLYTAFQYGAPPHAGMAPGIDRILMLLKDEENIREMVAFPLGANGADAMMGCPGEVFEKQLRETHIKVRD